MIELPSLYDHQMRMRDHARKGLAHYQRVILSAPPGTGKTRIAKWILGACENRTLSASESGKYLFAVHRRGLVDNASNSFNESPGLPHGVVMSGVDPAWGHRVHVASIDTLLSWFVKNSTYDTNITFDLIIFDETHSHLAKLQRFLEHHDAMRAEQGRKPAYVLGLTATPQAKGLADTYADIVPGPKPQWLIDNGFLSPFRYVGGKQGQLGLLVRKGSEFTKDSEAKAMEGLAGDLVRDWKKYADGRPTVGFFPRRSHAQDALQELLKAGLRTAYIDGETSDEERHRIFWEMGDGRLDYICNVQVVERGTDIPRVACVQLCVAIGSLTRYLQMIGRGSRVHPSKTDCLILDHGGNVFRHGLFEDDPQWCLDQSRNETREQSDRPTIQCPNCDALYRGGRCRQCGYEPTPKERMGQGLEFNGEELVPITKKKEPQLDPHALFVQMLFSMGRSGMTWSQLAGRFRGECRKQGKNYLIPKHVVIAGHRYELPRYGHPMSGRAVKELFPVVTTKKHGGPFDLGPVDH